MVIYYGSGMHDFVLRECEVGTRVAMAEDAEWIGGPDCLYFERRGGVFDDADRWAIHPYPSTPSSEDG